MSDQQDTSPPVKEEGRSFKGDERSPVPVDPFNLKIMAHLADRVILKPLTRWNEAYKEFPRYVMEYLVSRYVDAHDPVNGQRKIDRILTERYAESAKKELIKSRIKENGEYSLLGQLSVRLDQARDQKAQKTHRFCDSSSPRTNSERTKKKFQLRLASSSLAGIEKTLLFASPLSPGFMGSTFAAFSSFSSFFSS